MSEYNPDDLAEQAGLADDYEQPTSAEITDVTQDVAHNIFGDKSLSAPDKEYLQVTAETDNGDEVEGVFALPESERSWLNPTFKLARFRHHYDDVPREGMDVSLSQNDDGFLEIYIPEKVETDE